MVKTEEEASRHACAVVVIPLHLINESGQTQAPEASHAAEPRDKLLSDSSLGESIRCLLALF